MEKMPFSSHKGGSRWGKFEAKLSTVLMLSTLFFFALAFDKGL